MNRVSVLFDGDFGVDDALALALAANSSAIKILAVTSVFGAATADKTANNALKVLELVGRTDVPVAVGADKAIMSQLGIGSRASAAHGADGLAGCAGLLAEPRRKPEGINAVQLMSRALSESECNAVLVCTGPLTNAATFILSHPDLCQRIDGIAFAGGAVFGGDALPSAEFNVAQDPEATKIVFSSGVRILMCGLDATDRAYLARSDIERTASYDTPRASFFSRCLDAYSRVFGGDRFKNGCPAAAALPVAWLLDPDVIETRAMYIDIDLDGRYTRGCTAADVLAREKKPANVVAATACAREHFAEMIENICK